MSWLLEDAYVTADSIRQGLTITGCNKEMWRALFSALELIPVVGNSAEKIGELLLSLQSDPKKSMREQFLKALTQISEKSADHARAVFMIDPAKYMQKDGAEAWSVVVRDLPSKIKLVFAQRPDDVLVDSETFGRLPNVVRIPERSLDSLDCSAMDELIWLRCRDLPVSIPDVTTAVSRYKGHPFATDAALRLVRAGTPPSLLPSDPSGIAERQWKEICRKGKHAIQVFEAYAVFPVAMPDEAIVSVCELSLADLKSLVADPYLGGLIHQEANGRRIYHAILMDFIRQQVNPAKCEDYHDRLAGMLRSTTSEDRFLRVMLHELRSPIVMISSAADYLRHKPAEGKIERIVDDIEAATDLVIAILENISFLTSSRRRNAVALCPWQG